MTERLSVEQVIQLNVDECAETGENAAVLDREGLEAALERPWSGFGDMEHFSTIYLKAAALLHGLASRQVFETANKRTAWDAAVVLLEANDVYIGRVEPVHAAMFVRAAALDHSLEISDIAEWFEVAHMAVKGVSTPWGDAGPSMTIIGGTVQLASLVGDDSHIRRLHAVDVTFVGPAVVIERNSPFVECSWDAAGTGVEGVLWEVDPERVPAGVIGAIGLEECLFERCNFTKIGLAGPADYIQRFFSVTRV